MNTSNQASGRTAEHMSSALAAIERELCRRAGYPECASYAELQARQQAEIALAQEQAQQERERQARLAAEWRAHLPVLAVLGAAVLVAFLLGAFK